MQVRNNVIKQQFRNKTRLVTDVVKHCGYGTTHDGNTVSHGDFAGTMKLPRISLE